MGKRNVTEELLPPTLGVSWTTKALVLSFKHFKHRRLKDRRLQAQVAWGAAAALSACLSAIFSSYVFFSSLAEQWS